MNELAANCEVCHASAEWRVLPTGFRFDEHFSCNVHIAAVITTTAAKAAVVSRLADRSPAK